MGDKLRNSEAALQAANAQVAEMEEQLEQKLTLEEQKFLSATTEIKTLNDNIASRDVAIQNLQTKFVDCQSDRNRTEDARDELRTLHANFAELNNENKLLRKNFAAVSEDNQELRYKCIKAELEEMGDHQYREAVELRRTQISTIVMANVLTLVVVSYLAYNWGKSMGMLEMRKSYIVSERITEKDEPKQSETNTSSNEDIMEEMSTTSSRTASVAPHQTAEESEFSDNAENNASMPSVAPEREIRETNDSPLPGLESLSDFEDEGCSAVCSTESEEDFEVIPQEDANPDVETIPSFDSVMRCLDGEDDDRPLRLYVRLNSKEQ